MQCLLAGKVPMSEYFAIDYTPHDITPYSKFFVSKFLKTITTNTGRNVAPEGDIPRQQGDQGSMTGGPTVVTMVIVRREYRN